MSQLRRLIVPLLLAAQVSSQGFSGQNPPCNICGQGQTITTPLASVGDTNGLSFGNCLTLSTAAENGFISPAQCIFLRTSNGLRSSCGCAQSSSPTPAPKGKTNEEAIPVSPPTFSPGMNPICYVCGSSTAKVGKRNAIVTVPPELNSPIPVVPCGTIEDAGLGQLIPESACTVAQETLEFREVCGCVDATPPMVPQTLAPVSAPMTDPQDNLAKDETMGPTTSPKTDMTATKVPSQDPANPVTAAAIESGAIAPGGFLKLLVLAGIGFIVN